MIPTRKTAALPSGTALAACVLLLFSGCGRREGHAVNVMGSTSVQPFAELVSEEYIRLHPDKRVEVQGGGSTAGIQALASGLAEIGMCSRSLKPQEASDAVPLTIARDALAIVVHRSNPISDLSIQQLREVFAGRVADWKDVGGKPGPVRVITREEGSGTREAFTQLVMAKARISDRALTQESNGCVRELVEGDRASIGYMSLGLVGDAVKPVRVDDITPTHENVLNNSYKLVRPFLFVTNERTGPQAREFIDFILSDKGQSILEEEGLVRAR